MIGTLKEIRDLFDCIQELECMIKNFNENYLGKVEDCAYLLTLKFIDILRQSSNGKHGGRESLFGVHCDNMEERKQVVLSVIVQLNKVESAMQILGGQKFTYSKKGQGVMFLSELWHESLYAHEGTVKMAFFFTGTNNLRSEARTARLRVEERWVDDETGIMEDGKKSRKV